MPFIADEENVEDSDHSFCSADLNMQNVADEHQIS